MSEAGRKNPTIKPATASERAAREARLAEEMRLNLLKRKAQRHAVKRAPGDDGEPGDDHPA